MPLDDIKDEFELLKSLDHPNIARIYEAFEDASNAYVVSEPLFGGDLTTLITKAKENGVTPTYAWTGGVTEHRAALRMDPRFFVCFRQSRPLRSQEQQRSVRINVGWRHGIFAPEESTRTINTSRKATGGLPNHQTPFDPHVLRYEP